MEIKIEKGIPLPSRGKRQETDLYKAIASMGVGDSVVLPRSMSNRVGVWGKRMGFKFSQRTINFETFRAWRVA